MTHVLAIDQSTSATKAVLFDATGRAVDIAVREHRQIFPQPGWVEHDAEEIWQNVLAVVRDIAARQPDKIKSAIALAITNQRETIVVFDRQTGRPLHNAIVWQCRRGAPICERLAVDGHAESVHSKTGLKLDTYFSASKLKWLADADASLHRKLEDGTALIGTIDAYLVYRLTEGAVFATDHTNASRTLLFDIRRLRWDEELCSIFGVPMHSLPEVRESFGSFGETCVGRVLPTKLPICGVMGDSQASLFAQGCFEPGTGKATFGSGTSVLINSGDRFEPSADQSVTALAWVRDGHPTYASEGLINYSSATVTWLKDQLGLIRTAAETEQLAEAVADNDGVYLVPSFAGLSAPYWKPEARAAIVGMTGSTRKEHIVRAALESIAYQIRDVLEMMRAHANVVPRMLYADGGPTRNRFLVQFTADITGAELRVADVAESSARGAALAAMLGTGAVHSLAELSELPRESKVYRRQTSAEKADALYAGWQQAVKRVL
jgi:glycerol kinase